MTYKQIGSIDALRADAFKVWAKIDEGNEDVINVALRDAALRIQEYTNIALIPCTIRQIAPLDAIRLMLPIGEVVSVTDSKGNECDFSFSGFALDFTYSGYIGKVAIEYTTIPDAAQIERMLIPIWELALAIYDGNTEEQNRVINRLPLELC
ncbi:MAG: hypothetical protein J6R25_00680 [Bacteroidales bacterium]|nr:hypothetical protein [Bacteroidales bacterium]